MCHDLVHQKASTINIYIYELLKRVYYQHTACNSTVSQKMKYDEVYKAVTKAPETPISDKDKLLQRGIAVAKLKPELKERILM